MSSALTTGRALTLPLVLFVTAQMVFLVFTAIQPALIHASVPRVNMADSATVIALRTSASAPKDTQENIVKREFWL